MHVLVAVMPFELVPDSQFPVNVEWLHLCTAVRPLGGLQHGRRYLSDICTTSLTGICDVEAGTLLPCREP